MKYLIRLIFIIFMTYASWSQNKGVIHYGQIESIGLKSPVGPDFNAYLAFNTNESYYVVAKDSLDKDTEFKKFYSTEDGMVKKSYVGNTMTNRFGRQVYYNRLKDSLYWNQWINFYVAEKKPKIDWQLEKETKKIGNFVAHKAIGFFRGRTYTVWYILEIPLPFGPWKLQGLPGLIMEAYDEHKEMYFYFKSLEYPTQRDVAITQVKRPDDHPKTWKTLEDFKKRLEHIYERYINTSITIAEKYKTEVPEQKVKREKFIESFD